MTPEPMPSAGAPSGERDALRGPLPGPGVDLHDPGRTATREPSPRARPAADPRDDFASLGVAELRSLAISRLGRSGRFRADVLLLERNGARAVLKDFGASGIRAAIGAILVARETRTYAALSDEPCVPRFYRRAGRAALLLEWRDAGPLYGRDPLAASTSFFVEFGAAVDRLHARGIAHLDLRKHRNVLVDRRGLPVIVDFAAAVRPRRFSPLRLWMPFLRAIDRGAVLKHRRRALPSTLSPRERRAEWVFRALGRAWKLVRLH